MLAVDLAVVLADAARSHNVPAFVKMFEEPTEELEMPQALNNFLGQYVRRGYGMAWSGTSNCQDGRNGARRGSRTSIQLIACQTRRN